MSATTKAASRRGSWLSIYIVAYLIFLYLPVALIPLFSFNDSVQAAFPLKGFTLAWYATLVGNEALTGALENSLLIGVVSASLATICGVTIAYMDIYGRSRLAGTISAIARLPILIPGVIIGISLLILVNLAGVGPSRLAIVLGHILVALPTTTVIMRGRFAGIPRSIPEAAEDLGAREAVVFRRIMLPLALPAVGSAFMLAFLTSFDEFIVAFFLAGTQPTLPLYIWSQLRFPKSLPTVMALGTAILAVSIIIAGCAELLRKRGLRTGRGLQPRPQKKTKRRTAMAYDKTSRMSLGGRLAAIALTLVSATMPAHAADKLTYFTWSGYELADFNKSFNAAHPDSVDTSVFGDDDDAFTKVKAGFHPDIAHPCYDKVARWNKEGLLQPIDTARIKNWDKIFPVFRNLPDLQAGAGKVWMVPWDWGNTSILYRTDLVKNPEQSWNLLWDKQYAGRIATIDAVHDTPVVAAILAGVSPFDMTPDQMNKVADKLREQRPLVSTYTTDMTSVEQSLASGQLVAAMTWNASAVALKKQGVPVEFMKPKEGMLTWACGFVMLKDSKNTDLAYDFINSRLEAESGKFLIDSYGYGASTSTAFATESKEALDNLQLPADPETMLKTTIFTGPMKQNDDLAKMFEKVKAGG